MRTKPSLAGNIFAWIFAFISIAPFVYVLALSFIYILLTVLCPLCITSRYPAIRSLSSCTLVP